MGTKIVESGVGSIASDESASLAPLHLQIGRGCSPLSTYERKTFQIGKVLASQQVELYRFLILFNLCNCTHTPLTLPFKKQSFEILLNKFYSQNSQAIAKIRNFVI